MKKLGIFGGTFNPIHIGHINLAKRAYDEYALDKVLFIPSGISYLKKDQIIPAGRIRLDMVDLAIGEYDYFESSDLEIIRPGNTYTVETLRELKRIYPDYELYFITGADILYSIDTWYESKRVLSLCKLLVSVRNGAVLTDMQKHAESLTERYDGKIDFMNSDNIEISSSDIRTDYERYKAYLPNGVYEYIKEHEIYI